MEDIEFKKWVQTQIKTNLVPFLKNSGFKKCSINYFARERNNIVQYLRFEIKRSKVRLYGGICPIYFPFQVLPYCGFQLPAAERQLCANGIYVPIPVQGAPSVTAEAVSQWSALESIIQKSIIPQFDKISNLDELMAASPYDVPDNDVWNGVKWYAQGVYQCLSGEFQTGIKQLTAAYHCKQGFLKYLEDIGRQFEPQKVQLDAIFSYIELLYCTISSKGFNRERFLTVYAEIVSESKKWYKL